MQGGHQFAPPVKNDRLPKLLGFGQGVGDMDQLGIVYPHLVEASEDDIRLGGPIGPTDRLRPLFRRTLIVNGAFDRQRADAVVRSGVADLVSFGRGSWPTRTCRNG